MSRVSTGKYGGRSAAQRRAERRERFLDAGLELIGSRGWSATTVRGVCVEAGLTSRFFYESFDNLDALAVAVFDRVAEDATERVLRALAAAPADTESRVRAAIEALVGALTDDPRNGRVAFIEAFGCEALLQRRQATMGRFARLIADQARSAVELPAGEDPLIDLTGRLLAGGLAELLIAWLQGEIEIGRERLIDDCVALFTATAKSAVVLARTRRQRVARER